MQVVHVISTNYYEKILAEPFEKDEQECNKTFLNMYNIHKIMLNVLKKI